MISLFKEAYNRGQRELKVVNLGEAHSKFMPTVVDSIKASHVATMKGGF